MHAVDAADAVLGLAGGIGQGVALVQAACVDAGKSQLAAVRHEHLEDQHHGGRGGIGRHGHLVALAVAAHGRGHVQRRRQQIADGIQHGLYAAVAQGGAAEHRGHGPAQGGPAQGGAHVVQTVFPAQIQVEEGLVGLGQMLQQAFPPGLGHGGFRIVPGAAGHGAALVGLVEVQMLAGQQVQHAVESLALSVGDGQGQGIGAQTFFHAFQHIGEISAHPVHLVDEGDLGHAKALRLPPDRLGLRFHTGHAAEHAHRTVQHAQGALHLDGEVHMAGRVDEVDGVLVPLAGGAGRHDGDAALLLLGHVVHGGGTVMDFPQAVDLAAVVEHALRERGLARVDVGDDADIADVFHGSLVNVWAGRSRQDGESMRFPAVARKRRGWWRRWRRDHRLSCPGGLQQAEGPATAAEKVRRQARVQPEGFAAGREQ